MGDEEQIMAPLIKPPTHKKEKTATEDLSKTATEERSVRKILKPALLARNLILCSDPAPNHKDMFGRHHGPLQHLRNITLKHMFQSFHMFGARLSVSMVGSVCDFLWFGFRSPLSCFVSFCVLASNRH